MEGFISICLRKQSSPLKVTSDIPVLFEQGIPCFSYCLASGAISRKLQSDVEGLKNNLPRQTSSEFRRWASALRFSYLESFSNSYFNSADFNFL